MAEAALSEDGKYFSFLSQDGRLKIWDAETNVLKQEYTPDLHLSAPPSCLQWITISNKSVCKHVVIYLKTTTFYTYFNPILIFRHNLNQTKSISKLI